MSLSDKQIERYSRQILVAGGVAQERLLAASVAILGAASAVEPALRYLVGAGVGRLVLRLIGADNAMRDQLIARMRALDSNVAIQSEELPAEGADVRLMIIGDGEVLAAVQARRSLPRNAALVVVRLDPPVRIAILPHPGAPSPMLEAELLGPWPLSSSRDASAAHEGFVTMVAVTEVLKLLTQEATAAEAIVIDFDGYQTRTRRLAQDASA